MLVITNLHFFIYTYSIGMLIHEAEKDTRRIICDILGSFDFSSSE